MGQIIAIGGLGQPAGLAGAGNAGGARIYRYLLAQSGERRPRVCFLPTASGESRERIVQFYGAFSALPCEPTWLSLFDPPTADLEDFLLSKDIIYVGGGNTRSMLALWREWRVDRILQAAYERGIVLAGSSAGANCWFEQCTTDSIPGELTVLGCLGFLRGSFTPHYDVEPKRKPTLHRMLLSGEIAGGYAADNESAIHFVEGRVARAVRASEAATAYRVFMREGTLVEEPLEMSPLGEAE